MSEENEEKKPLTLSFALWSMYQKFLDYLAYDESAWGVMAFFSGALLLLLGICGVSMVSTVVDYLRTR